MDRDTLRALAKCRRALLELYALPPGSLPDELEDLIEELVAPGFRERVSAAFLASMPTGKPNQGRPRTDTPLTQGLSKARSFSGFWRLAG